MDDNLTAFNVSSNITETKGIDNRNQAYFIAAFVFQWVNAFLIITLNIAVIVTILRYKKRSRLYFLLLNLAIADLLTGVIDAFPNAIERSLGFNQNVQIWYAGDVMCKIYKMAGNVSMMSSNYILAVTSIDRALVVYKPMLHFKKGRIWQKCIVVGCWVVSVACSTPLLKIASVKPSSNSCVTGFESDTIYWWKMMIIYLFVVIFVIPFIIIVISYTILVVSIYRRSLEPTTRGEGQTKGNPNHRLSRVFNRAVPKSKIKSLKLTVGIVLSFIISWSLFFIFMFLQIFAEYQSRMMMLFVTCYYWNCIANPVLFFIFHRRKIRSNTASHSFYSSENGAHSSTISTEVFNRSQNNQSSYKNNIPLLTQCGLKSSDTEQNKN